MPQEGGDAARPAFKLGAYLDQRRGQQHADAVCASTLPKDRHRLLVPAKSLDVLLDPPQRGDLIQDTIVAAGSVRIRLARQRGRSHEPCGVAVRGVCGVFWGGGRFTTASQTVVGTEDRLEIAVTCASRTPRTAYQARRAGS